MLEDHEVVLEDHEVVLEDHEVEHNDHEVVLAGLVASDVLASSSEHDRGSMMTSTIQGVARTRHGELTWIPCGDVKLSIQKLGRLQQVSPAASKLMYESAVPGSYSSGSTFLRR